MKIGEGRGRRREEVKEGRELAFEGEREERTGREGRVERKDRKEIREETKIETEGKKI